MARTRVAGLFEQNFFIPDQHRHSQPALRPAVLLVCSTSEARTMSHYETGLFLNRIPYAKIGNGPNPIVVLNGGQAFVRRTSPARTLRDARRIARLLPPGSTFYMLGYDQAPPAGYTIGTISSDFAGIIRNAIGPASVVGISYGGFIAARLAAEQPDLVRNLILLVSAHRFSEPGRHSIDRQIECAWQGDFLGLLAEFGMVFRRPWFNWLLKARFWLERSRLHEKMGDPVSIVRGLHAVTADEADRDPSWLRGIRARTLIVGGTRDQFFDTEVLEEAASLIPNAQLKLFAKETHMLPVERARDVAKVISHFLDGG